MLVVSDSFVRLGQLLQGPVVLHKLAVESQSEEKALNTLAETGNLHQRVNKLFLDGQLADPVFVINQQLVLFLGWTDAQKFVEGFFI
jgi:hypothetical protein